MSIAASQLAPTSRSHWSKDFVEHLRTVHFALILVATILIVTGTNTESTRITAALTQIQQIAKFEHQWPTVLSKVYERAMLDAKLESGWSPNIAIVVPRDIYAKGEIDTYFRVPIELVYRVEPWKAGGVQFPTELNNLSEFRDFWNTMNKGVRLTLLKPPGTESSCTEAVRIEHPDGSRDLIDDPLGNTPNLACKVGYGLLTAISGPTFESNYSFSPFMYDGRLHELNLWVNTELPLQTASKYRRENSKKLFSVTEIRIDTAETKIDETALKRLFFTDWRPGAFEAAFPELSSVSRGLSTLGIDDAARRLESQVASAEKNISLLGFSVPIPQLSQWGFLVLLSVQFYLWLHLHELSTRIGPDAEGWDVAWIGVYRTRAATLVAVISCFVLPTLAAITLGRNLTLSAYYRRTALTISIAAVLLSAGVGLLTIWRLARLRANLREIEGA